MNEHAVIANIARGAELLADLMDYLRVHAPLEIQKVAVELMLVNSENLRLLTPEPLTQERLDEITRR